MINGISNPPPPRPPALAKMVMKTVNITPKYSRVESGNISSLN
jgi:hypothetical protein